MRMCGEIDEQLVPTVRVRLAKRERPLACLVDSGFNGDLALPSALVSAHRMKLRHIVPCELANGQTVLMPAYEWNLMWFGTRSRVEVLESDSEIPIIGLRLVRGKRLTIDLIDWNVVITNERGGE